MTIMEALGGHNGQTIVEVLGGQPGQTIADVVTEKGITPVTENVESPKSASSTKKSSKTTVEEGE